MRLMRTFALGLVLLLLLLSAQGWCQTQIPDTPAGHVLRAWLDAFNSGDRSKAEAYAKNFDPRQSADGMLAMRSQTGGLDLLSIDHSEPLSITFRVKERASSNTAVGSLNVKGEQTPTVQGFELRLIPPGAVVENVKLDAAARQRIIDAVATSLKKFYVYPETANKMVDALDAEHKKGAFDSITDGNQFAYTLTRELQDVSHDKHLRVEFSPVKLPPENDKGPSQEDKARFTKMMQQSNCGFEKVEVLPGNIGYVKFNMFADTTICGATATATMNFVAHTGALIFDLRENGGGRPEMVALIASYLFDKPTHLNDLYNREKDTTTQYWTSYVSGTTMPDIPVFVLTSKRTFSGAEEFAYDLQNRQRATIVGETTGGGAHPVSGHRLDDHFMIGVPFARAINPVTKTNWEGTGVKPDVAVDAAQALETAEKLAKEKMKTN